MDGAGPNTERAGTSDVWDEHRASTYDDDVADEYDDAQLRPCIDTLVDLAGGQRVLEFAIGTGRVALPLTERGLDVSGIELSRPMIDRLRAKPGGTDVLVIEGDMATMRLPGGFGLVFLVFNTIMNLTTQEAQTECFANAARHLVPGGRFVVETIVPPVERMSGGRLAPFHLSDERIGIDEIDTATQLVRSHHVRRRADGVTWTGGAYRYVWPSELDLMARLAGLRLEHRWADWRRAPFDSTSDSHVSVYRRT